MPPLSNKCAHPAAFSSVRLDRALVADRLFATLLAYTMAMESQLEVMVRVSIFVAVLTTMLVLEQWFAAVTPPPQVYRRRLVNLALGFCGVLVGRVLAPVVGIAAAESAESGGIGLLRMASLPPAAIGIIGFLSLDLAVYWQHRAMHAVPLLWRLHRVHHAETHLDASAGVRFHPLEIMLSALWRAAIIWALGIPPAVVVAFEVAINALALFNHANLRLAPALESTLRLWLITPSLHRIHHSVLPGEQRRNFGFSVPWWDRWFGSLLQRSAQAEVPPVIGISDYGRGAHRLLDMLSDPINKSVR
jgi:sterol desaturase/sphingolipid hydroxylase (fatty acid hydroxylase superfamily)